MRRRTVIGLDMAVPHDEKAVHVKAYKFNFKPKQREYAVSSIGVMEDSSLCMFATRSFAPLIRGFAPFHIFAFGCITFCSKPNNIAIMKQ